LWIEPSSIKLSVIRRAVVPSAYFLLASHRSWTSKMMAVAKMINHPYEHGKVNFKYMSELLLYAESRKVFPRVWMDDSAACFATVLRMCLRKKSTETECVDSKTSLRIISSSGNNILLCLLKPQYDVVPAVLLRNDYLKRRLYEATRKPCTTFDELSLTNCSIGIPMTKMVPWGGFECVNVSRFRGFRVRDRVLRKQ
jgi:hypothetical protein